MPPFQNCRDRAMCVRDGTIPKLPPENEISYDHPHKTRRTRSKGCSDHSDQGGQTAPIPIGEQTEEAALPILRQQ